MATGAQRRPAAGGPLPPCDDLRLEKAFQVLDERAIEVVSTDIFDTLVWRQVPEPVDAFPVVGAALREERMLSRQLSPRAFARIRQRAEALARERRAHAHAETEVTLSEIYALIPDWVFGRRPIDRARAVACEVAVEKELLVPDLDVVELLVAAVERGKRVVAVSDTYFSEAHLRELLAQPVLEQVEFERVFSSSDHRTNKSGGLFEVVLDRLGVAPSSVLHMGDNEEADVTYPGRLEIQTLYFERQVEAVEELMGEEARFIAAAPALASESAPDNALVSGLTATRSKVVTRAEASAMPPALRAHWTYGALVLGPVLTGFAEWVVTTAHERELSRLGCLMREGSFLAELINRAAENRGLPVEAEPLFVNRFLCDKASIGEASAGEIEPFLGARNPLTVAQLCRRLGVDLADMPRFFAHADTRLDDFVLRRNLVEELTTNPQVREAILEDARELRERIARYIERQLPDGVRHLAVVDLGWAASTQHKIAVALRNARTDIGVTGMYLLTHAGATESVLGGTEVLGFLANMGVPQDAVETIMRSPEVLEQALMPDHGTQIGLTEELEPVLEEVRQGTLQSVEADAVRKGMLAFQRHWHRYDSVLPGKIRPLEEAGDLLRSVYLRSVAAPTAEEAATFGRWQHDENRGSSSSEPIANAGAAPKMRYMDPAALRDIPMSELYWPFAMAAQVDPTWRDLIAAAAAGQVSWDALRGSDADIGRFHAWASRGADVVRDDKAAQRVRLNRRGLGYVRFSLVHSQIQEVTLRPTERPAVMRIDWLEFRLHAQGRADPIVVRCEAPGSFGQIVVANAFQVQPNLFVIHGGEPRFILDVERFTPRIVFRVEVECGFAAMPASELLPAEGRFQNIEEADRRLAQLEQGLRDIKASPSWRLTKPLRAAKRLAGRLR